MQAEAPRFVIGLYGSGAGGGWIGTQTFVGEPAIPVTAEQEAAAKWSAMKAARNFLDQQMAQLVEGVLERGRERRES